MTKEEFRNFFLESFNLEEMKDIVYDLDVYYEDLDDSKKNKFGRELIEACKREGKSTLLLRQCQRKRSRITWQLPPQDSKIQDTINTPTSSRVAWNSVLELESIFKYYLEELEEDGFDGFGRLHNQKYTTLCLGLIHQITKKSSVYRLQADRIVESETDNRFRLMELMGVVDALVDAFKIGLCVVTGGKLPVNFA